MRPGDFLLHPAFGIAVIVLILNDHILKWTFGNHLTGKASDVAGVFLLPLLMLAFLEGARRALRMQRWAATRGEILAAVAVVGAGFAAVKLVPVVGDAYEYMVGLLRKLVTFSSDPVVPIIVYRDATDLVVLPVLIGTYLIAVRSRPNTMSGVSGPKTQTREFIDPPDSGRAALDASSTI